MLLMHDSQRLYSEFFLTNNENVTKLKRMATGFKSAAACINWIESTKETIDSTHVRLKVLWSFFTVFVFGYSYFIGQVGLSMAMNIGLDTTMHYCLVLILLSVLVSFGVSVCIWTKATHHYLKEKLFTCQILLESYRVACKNTINSRQPPSVNQKKALEDIIDHIDWLMYHANLNSDSVYTLDAIANKEIQQVAHEFEFTNGSARMHWVYLPGIEDSGGPGLTSPTKSEPVVAQHAVAAAT